MKVISLNTWSGVVLEPQLDFFRRHAPDIDIFCLQEVYFEAKGKEEWAHPTLDFKFDIYERIQDVLAETHVGVFHPCYRDFYGLAMFIRKDLPVEEQGEVKIFENEHPEQRGLHGRNLQYVRVSMGARNLVIANVHGLWNGRGKTDTDDRLEQSRRIASFVKSRNEPLVLIGDFNLNPDTESLAIAGAGLRNLVDEHGITSTRTSFYVKDGKYADYAFVSAGIEVKDFQVLPDEVSDHAPLYLEFDIA